MVLHGLYSLFTRWFAHGVNGIGVKIPNAIHIVMNLRVAQADSDGFLGQRQGALALFWIGICHQCCQLTEALNYSGVLPKLAVLNEVVQL